MLLLLFCNLTEKHSFHIECLSIHQSVVMAPRPIWLEWGKYNMLLTFLQPIREGPGVQWPQIAYYNCFFQQTWRDNRRGLGELRWKTRRLKPSYIAFELPTFMAIVCPFWSLTVLVYCLLWFCGKEQLEHFAK